MHGKIYNNITETIGNTLSTIWSRSLAPYTLLPEQCRLVERAHGPLARCRGPIAGTRWIMLGSRGVNRHLRHYGRGVRGNDSMLLI